MAHNEPGDAWLKIKEHFEGQSPGRDEVKKYMDDLAIQYNIDVDIDDSLVDMVYSFLGVEGGS